MKINKKLKLATAIAAGMALVGCLDDGTVDTIAAAQVDENAESGRYVESVQNSSCFNADTCSASGYEFPEGAVFVAADAADGSDITDALTQAIDDVIATPDSVLVLPKGTFKVTNTIGIQNSNNLTLTGHGIRSTTLDFSDSTGEDGLNIQSGSGLVLRDLSVNEAGKNAIAASSVSGIHFNYVGTVWDVVLTTDTESAYGIYPVSCSDVVVENSYAKGSNDAGIYVGQSNNVVVRNNVAEYNIAGIEIENTNNADVYNNVATRNSGGLLSFDLPIPGGQSHGTNTRWFNNASYNNNTTNVGPGTVGKVPTGTGMLVLATDDVEIYNNNFYDNKSSAVAIASYFLIEDDVAKYGDPSVTGSLTPRIMEGWSPMTRNVQVHDNTLANNSYAPDTQSLLVEAIAGYLTGASPFTGNQPVTFPTVVYDGIGEMLANLGAFAPLVLDNVPEAGDMSVATLWPFITGGGNPANGVAATPGPVLPYSAGQTHCVYDNTVNNPEGLVASIGSLYGTDPTDANNWVDGTIGGTPQATLRYSTMGDAATLLNCDETTNPRLPASNATIRGVVYGCGTGGDDESTEAACAL